MSTASSSPANDCTAMYRESQVSKSTATGRKPLHVRENCNSPEVDYINTAEAAKIAGVDINTIYRWTTRYRPRYRKRKRGQYCIYKPAFLDFLAKR